MGYNRELENRIDKLLEKLGKIHKKTMFGGIGYLSQGNLCFGIYKESLVLRTSGEKAEALLKEEYVSPFNITGRTMKGWVLVSPDRLRNEEQLLEILKLGFTYVSSLPRK